MTQARSPKGGRAFFCLNLALSVQINQKQKQKTKIKDKIVVNDVLFFMLLLNAER
jgi:hypothetical protein